MAPEDTPPAPRHGQYKMPGGKLVHVEFEVRDGALREVRVSGDFFLEPPEALDDLRAALEGAPADAGAAELAARLDGGLREGAVLLGTSPAAVAEAAVRALAAPGGEAR